MSCSKNNLPDYLDKHVTELVAPLEVTLTEEQKERHRIYVLLVMAITHHYWNGNKYGRDSTYPLNPLPSAGGVYLDKDYIGHNIAAVAVNELGYVIDFEFNHNNLYNSSVEHAESRLMRRVFSLTGAPLNTGALEGAEVTEESMPMAGVPMESSTRYGTQLPGVSIYTSLESCSQCSGIMALGTVKEVIFLQPDPGMYFIGNILRRLTEGGGLQAPLPIPGSDIDLSYYTELEKGEQTFWNAQCNKEGKPFSISDGSDSYSTSMTSFLCTDMAYKIFSSGREDFTQMELNDKTYKPSDSALTNEEALEKAREFSLYAINQGRRATPHRV